jgi:UDP-GlcNAc:undecaprenyl-phosphate GlcNAc-1-phosphate transferase
LHAGSSMAFFITLFLLPVIIKVAANKKVFVTRHFRKVHQGNISALGGIAIFSGVLFSMLFFSEFMDVKSIRYYIAAGSFVFIFGLSDDFRAMSPLYKLAGQIMAALLIVFPGDMRIQAIYILGELYMLPYLFSVLLSVSLIIWIINSYNFFDGIDLQAALVGIAFLLPAGIWFYFTQQYNFSLLLLSTSMALLSFSFFNHTPSKIFMGDAGTVTIGFIMAFAMLKFFKINVESSFLDTNISNPILFALVSLQLPLFDSLRVITLRLVRGKNPTMADKSHLHHIFLRAGWKHKSIAWFSGLYTLITLLLNYQLFRNSWNGYAIFILNLCLLSIVYFLVFKLANWNKKLKSA